MSQRRITPAQLKKLHTMFSKLGMDAEEYHAMVAHITDNRTSCTKDLTFGEANYMISYLSGCKSLKTDDSRKYQEDRIKVIGQIYHLSFLIGMCYGDSPEDIEMNCAVINKFCRERGTVKKEVNQMNLKELNRTKRQFEAMLNRNLDSAVKKLVGNSLKTKKAII